MNAQDIKSSILQLAIQGKLVEQRAEDGTGRELLKEIEAEKKQLIKTGKLKKQKDLLPINEDEIPFEIPESWEWVRLSEVIDVRDGTHDTPRYVPNGIPLVTSKNLKIGKIDFESAKLISLEDAEKINLRSRVDIGDVLFAMIGSIGNPVLVTDSRLFSIKNMALFKKIPNTEFSMDYLCKLLELEQVRMKKRASGAVQSFVSLSFLREYLIPLPPLEEQKRIVAKIEELMPYVEKYDSAYCEVKYLNKKFPEDMQKSILQYALQGKLVEQYEEDGNVEDIYKQIQAEKKMSIKGWEISKSKSLPVITEDETPFEIPPNWKWCRMGNVIEFVNGRAYKKDELLDSGKYKVLRVGNFFTNNHWYYSDLELEKSKYCNKGDLLYAWSASFGPKIWNEDKTIFHYHIWKVLFNEKVLDRDYLYWFLLNDVSIIKRSTTGSAMIHISMENMKPRLIAIPPLEEQKRIVAKIEELLPHTKKLENNLVK